jgi:arginine N-succinyltransferase
MSFVVRNVRREDLSQLYDLARQFTLLNLPAEKRLIEAKIEKSEGSFAGEVDRSEAEYLFVLEDLETGFIAGSSMILAKSGTPKSANFSFEVQKRERFSKELGIGFIHQILRLKSNTDGPTEVGGLIVDRGYRRRPEKVGRLMSFSRFLYMSLYPERFEKELHAEMAPPLTEEGRSEFWESLGRRFTGMPYHEADMLSSTNNDFIRSLFPEEDIYLCLLDSRARLVLGQVGEETQAAMHLLKKMGFKYKNEVDPFDGGPHLGCPFNDCLLIKNMRKFTWAEAEAQEYGHTGLVGYEKDNEFSCLWTSYALKDGKIFLPKKACEALSLEKQATLAITGYDVNP